MTRNVFHPKDVDIWNLWGGKKIDKFGLKCFTIHITCDPTVRCFPFRKVNSLETKRLPQPSKTSTNQILFMLGLFFIIFVQVYCKDSVSSDESEPFLFLGSFSKLNKICGGTDVKTPRINFVMTVTSRGGCCFKGTDVFAEHLSCQGYTCKNTQTNYTVI